MQKTSKASVHYEPKATGKDYCGICVFFEPPKGCERVFGKINRGGWCDEFHSVKGHATADR